MTLSITDTLITSDITHHTARHVDGYDQDGWEVSWSGDERLTQQQALAAIELAEIAAKGRDGGPDTTNYHYLTWRRVMELSEVLGARPLKTMLYLEGLEKR